MKNSVKLAAAALAMAAVVAAPSLAQALASLEPFSFTYTDTTNGVSVSGGFLVQPGATDEVTEIWGTVSGAGSLGLGGAITGLVANGNFPGTNVVGGFQYNNVYYAAPTDPVFDIYGILFTTRDNPGGYWNLWGNYPGNYSLYASNSSGYPVATNSGTISVTAVPEMSTWFMMMAGFAAIGFAGYRRTRNERVTFGA